MSANFIGRSQPWLSRRSKFVCFVVGLSMASLWGLFAYRHIDAFRSTGDWAYLVMCISETLTACLFMVRSAPVTISKDPFDWFFALTGTFMAFLFVPSSWGLLPAGKVLIILAAGIQILGLLSLNRSLAIVAAKRTIKTGGMYSLVRHPLYASYLLMFTGYMLVNTTVWNAAIFVLTIGFLFVRAIREEKHLVLDPSYVEYMGRVRYRVLPFVF